MVPESILKNLDYRIAEPAEPVEVELDAQVDGMRPCGEVNRVRTGRARQEMLPETLARRVGPTDIKRPARFRTLVRLTKILFSLVARGLLNRSPGIEGLEDPLVREWTGRSDTEDIDVLRVLVFFPAAGRNRSGDRPAEQTKPAGVHRCTALTVRA